MVFSSNFAFWGPKFGPKTIQQNDPLGAAGGPLGTPQGPLGPGTASFEEILRTSRDRK